MKVNYFDFGLCSGDELHWMTNRYFPELGIEDYSAYGFEASYPHYQNMNNFFSENHNVEIVHCAIAEQHDVAVKLYHAENTVGHSIFSTKNNVNVNSFEEVRGVVFSQWLNECSVELDGCFNILKTNIEGAEWYLFNDIVDAGLVDYFSLFLGTGHDVGKIEEIDNLSEKYDRLLTDNNIEILRFTEHRPEDNDDVFNIINEKLFQLEDDHEE